MENMMTFDGAGKVFIYLLAPVIYGQQTSECTDSDFKLFSTSRFYLQHLWSVDGGISVATLSFLLK